MHPSLAKTSGSSGLPPAIQELQTRVETSFLREQFLEQEIKTLRATQPLICRIPASGGPVMRALRRLIPALRRAHELAMLRGCGLLDADWYRKHNPDVARSGMDPALHYWLNGAAEARSPGPYFDTAHYLAMYPDIAAGNLNPLVHYLRAGWREGRSIRPDMPHRPPSSAPISPAASTGGHA